MAQYFYEILKELPSGAVITSVGNANGVGTAAATDVGSHGIVGNADSVGTATAISLVPAASTRVGWFDEWDKKRRIPVEQLREILKAQGSSWADELGEAYEAVEKKIETSPKRRKVLEEALTDVSREVQTPQPGVDWAYICLHLVALANCSRETAARKHLEDTRLALQAYQAYWAAEYDDEEALLLLMNG